jgi:uncharacterized NAD(P)/FAD-binding protein YdhS
LNTKAQEMSAFEDDSSHFVKWIYANQNETGVFFNQEIPLEEQFVSRLLYGDYLQAILKKIQQYNSNHHSNHHSNKIKLKLISAEVIDVIPIKHQAQLIFNDGQTQIVDKVVLAVCNNPCSSLPFSFSQAIHYIANPWDTRLLKNIGQHDAVLIVGTGLTMIDVVLSLYHQQHQGKIYAVSRHGLLPLPHQSINISYFFTTEHIPYLIPSFTKFLRAQCKDFICKHGDWRPVMNALRPHIPKIWEKIHLSDKKKFLRHLLPYWNIHRHRMPQQTANFIFELSNKNQIHLLGGKILSVDNGMAKIKLRHSEEITTFNVNNVINCMGPSLSMTQQPPLIHSLLKRGMASLDALRLGLSTTSEGQLIDQSGRKSSIFYALGPPTKGIFWECTAVPEIRKQCFVLAKTLLNC